MFQAHKENIPCLSSWKEELGDSVSIRASKDDSFILEENLQRLPHSSTRRWQVSWLIYLLVATAGIISIFAAIYISKEKSHTCDGLGEVLDTELRSVQPAIEVQKIRFGGTLGFTENSTLIQIFWDPNAPRYTGDPSDELDARWHSLYQADGVDLRGMEADTIRGKTLEKPGGWSIVSLDVFHQLHCLDMLRQALRPDYYTRHDPEPAYTTHIHHCLDHIRQAVMCHVDVTPLPVLWAEKEDRPLNDFQVEHTCRNFWKVREWALERDAHKHKYKYNQPH